MTLEASDAVSTLRWGLRRYAALFLGCLLVVAVLVPALIAMGAPTYQAHALVVAQRLDTDLTALPRYAEATFGGGEVARAVAGRFGSGGDGAGVVPGQVSLVAEQDSIVLQVVGHADTAQGAADRANFAAAAFLEQLNLPGDGVGLFALQSSAVPPADPDKQLPILSVALPIGIAAGLILGFAAVALVLIVRRPVLAAGDAAETSGVPSLGTLTMARPKGAEPAAVDDIDGLVPVCRRILALQPRTVFVLAAPGSHDVRGQLAAAMEQALGRVRDVRFVPAPPVRAGTSGYADQAAPLAGPDAADRDDPTSALLLVEGPHPMDIVAPGPASMAVLLIGQGISERVLRATVAEQLGGIGTDRLVMVNFRGRRAGRAKPEPEERSTERYPARLTDPATT